MPVSNFNAAKLEQLLNGPSSGFTVRELVDNSDVFMFLCDSIEHIQESEGSELVDDPNDSGGLTKYGVTERTARNLGYKGEMADMCQKKAALIAAYEFYFRPKFYRLNEIVGPKFTYEVFDAAYLSSAKAVIELIQRFLNVANRQGKDWPDIGVDGILGEGETIPALESYLAKRGEDMLMKNFRGLMYTHFFTLCERREKDEKFFNGWVAERIGED